MGKVKARVLGLESVEKEQKDEQKRKAYEKKVKKAVKEVSAPQAESTEPKKPIAEKTKAAKKTVKVGAVQSRGRKYLAVKKLVDRSKLYGLSDAVALLKKLKTAKFDEAVELHLNVDKTGLKGELNLPHSTGKIVKVAVVDDRLLTQIAAGKLDFDILVAHPSFMPKLAKFAKLLGPKGLMPNPKAGTVSPRPEEVVKKFAQGVLRWKTEAKFPLVHQMIGKISMEDKQIVENTRALLSAVGKEHIQKAVIKLTLSPAVKLSLVENL